MKTVYAVLDTLAHDVVGPLQFHQHDAAAVRFFTDVAGMQGSMVARHPQDHELVRLGTLVYNPETRQLDFTSDYAVVITGTTWAAAQQAANQQEPQS